MFAWRSRCTKTEPPTPVGVPPRGIKRHGSNSAARAADRVRCGASHCGRRPTAAAEPLNLTWDPSPNPGVVGYVVYVRISGATSNSYDVGNTTAFAWNGAVDGQQYYFSVAAYTPGPFWTAFGGDSPLSEPGAIALRPGPQSSAVGSTVSLALTASDPEGAPLTYGASGLPAGLQVGAATGAITGSLLTTGTYTVTATVTDGSLSDAETFVWTITQAASDTVPPVVAVAMPTTASTYAVDQPFVLLGGTATMRAGSSRSSGSATANAWSRQRRRKLVATVTLVNASQRDDSSTRRSRQRRTRQILVKARIPGTSGSGNRSIRRRPRAAGISSDATRPAKAHCQATLCALLIASSVLFTAAAAHAGSIVIEWTAAQIRRSSAISFVGTTPGVYTERSTSATRRRWSTRHPIHASTTSPSHRTLRTPRRPALASVPRFHSGVGGAGRCAHFLCRSGATVRGRSRRLAFNGAEPESVIRRAFKIVTSGGPPPSAGHQHDCLGVTTIIRRSAEITSLLPAQMTGCSSSGTSRCHDRLRRPAAAPVLVPRSAAVHFDQVQLDRRS